MNILRWFASYLTVFRFARKHLGGQWYYIDDASIGKGEYAMGQYWTRDPGQSKILRTENYPAKGAAVRHPQGK